MTTTETTTWGLDPTTGERMTISRKRKKISQEQMADTFGVSRQAISGWERGTQPENALAVYRHWAELCDVPVLWLMYGADVIDLRPSQPGGEQTGKWAARDSNPEPAGLLPTFYDLTLLEASALLVA